MGTKCQLTEADRNNSLCLIQMIKWFNRLSKFSCTALYFLQLKAAFKAKISRILSYEQPIKPRWFLGQWRKAGSYKIDGKSQSWWKSDTTLQKAPPSPLSNKDPICALSSSVNKFTKRVNRAKNLKRKCDMRSFSLHILISSRYSTVKSGT